MFILGIDTSGRDGSVALARESEGRFEVLGAAPLAGGTYSAQLIPAISALLASASLAKSAIDLLAVASGPGSFTGLRVGLSTVKGLAEALKKPIVAVSVLAATAAACRAVGFGDCRARCTARRGVRGRVPGGVQRSGCGIESAPHRGSSAEFGGIRRLDACARSRAGYLHARCKRRECFASGRLSRAKSSASAGGPHRALGSGAISAGADHLIRSSGRKLPAPLGRGDISRSQAGTAAGVTACACARRSSAISPA